MAVMILGLMVGLGVAFGFWRLVSAGTLSTVPTPLASPTPEPTVIGDPREKRWFGRPLLDGAQNVSPDRTYLYGSTQGGRLRAHHGIDFQNPVGTPVYVAADGVVVVARSDPGKTYGPLNNFYGNVVIIRIPQKHRGQDVYYLNGHLSEILVREGQQVKAGDLIGRVGKTGVADGPHLHWEVKVGGVSYRDSRNPALWLRPLPGTGALAGQILDSKGQPIPNVVVTLYKDIQVADVQSYWGETATYVPDPLGPLNPDEDWNENFAFVDVPVGYYDVQATINGVLYSKRVAVREGRTTFLEIVEGSP